MKSENLVMKSNVLPTAPDIQKAINSTSHKLKIKKDRLLDAFFSRFINSETNQIELSEEEKLIVALRAAQNDWLIAKSNFAQACDQDLIDQAIYNIAAAEKRYQYLLKQARKENISAEIEDLDLNRSHIKYKEINM